MNAIAIVQLISLAIHGSSVIWLPISLKNVQICHLPRLNLPVSLANSTFLCIIIWFNGKFSNFRTHWISVVNGLNKRLKYYCESHVVQIKCQCDYVFITKSIKFNSFLCLCTQVIRTSAKSLAEKAGAAQYAVHIEEELSPDEIKSRHDQRKRPNDENVFDDSDYEIYQGVVGRPGIDFPVLTGIPQTSFSCRKFGNGYFADLETECQVIIILDF